MRSWDKDVASSPSAACTASARGGRNKQFTADDLIQDGFFAHTRNPLYLGNLLIAAGLVLIADSPAWFLVVLPLTVGMYCAIVLAEEAFLTARFGQTYVDYCQRVCRFLPTLTGLKCSLSVNGVDWQRALWKEARIFCAWVSFVLGLLIWEQWETFGFAALAGGDRRARLGVGDYDWYRLRRWLVAKEHYSVLVSTAETLTGVTKPNRTLHEVGMWVRRVRRYIAVPLAALTLLGLRPLLPAGSPFFNELTDWLGIGIAVLGQGLRGWAWGSNTPVETQGVRTRGPYALMRHPLYVGNLLIAWGLLLIFHNPWAYLFCGLSFVLLYQVVIVVEEQQMEERAGEILSPVRCQRCATFCS